MEYSTSDNIRRVNIKKKQREDVYIYELSKKIHRLKKSGIGLKKKK